MGLLSDKSNNRKKNRSENGRLGDRLAGFFDLREESRDENSSYGENQDDFAPSSENKNGYYEDEYTERDRNRNGSAGNSAFGGNSTGNGSAGSSAYGGNSTGSGSAGSSAYRGNSTGNGSAGRFSGFFGIGDREDNRPYRERHRVEVKEETDARSYGSGRANRALDVPEIGIKNNSRSSDFYSRAGNSRHGTEDSAYYDSRANGCGTEDSAYYDSRAKGYGTEESAYYDSRAKGYGTEESSFDDSNDKRYNQKNRDARELQSDWGFFNRRGTTSRTSRYSSRNNRNDEGTSRYSSRNNRNDTENSRYSTGSAQGSTGTSRYSSRNNRNDEGTSRYSSRNNRNDEGTSRYSSRNNRNDEGTSRYSSRNTRNDEGTSRYSSRYPWKDSGSSRSSSAYNHSGRSGSQGGMSRGNGPENYNENPAEGRDREVSADLFVQNNYSGRGNRSRVTRTPISSGGENRSKSWRERASEYRRNTSAPENRTEKGYDGFYSAPQNLNSPRRGTGGYGTGSQRYGNRGDERDYFYEEDLPAENLLWDGIGDDPDETLSDKRARQRDRIKQEREKELRKMYFRLGAGGAVALLVLIAVIAIAVVGFRKGKNKSNTVASAGTTQETAVVSEKGTETSSGENEGRNLNAEASDKDGQNSAGASEDTKETGTESKSASTDTSGKEDGETAEDGTEQDADTAAKQGTESADADNQKTASSDAGTVEAQNGTSATGTGTDYTHQDEWNLILVNPWHKLPEGYTVETTALLNGESVDSRCYSSLQQMLNDCQEQSGGIPIVCSSYRPHEKQVRLYEEQVATLMKAGKTREEAEKEAGTVVAVPGTSEHELGLAVDICDSENQMLDDSQANTKTQQWLMKNCWDYGFILRYPVNKSEITGIIYEPWHYRYVGVEAAREIRDRNICLEEYLAG